MKQTGIIFQILMFVAWAAGLGYLIYDSNYGLFLKPEFGPLIWISLGITLVFIISLIPLISSGVSQHQILIKGIILILPLGFILSSGDQTLGSYALSKRTMAGPAQVLDRGPEAGSSENMKPTNSEETISISTLVRNFNQFNGKKVQVEGLFSQTVQNHDELSAVFRYFITCCAADAQPVGVFLNRPDKEGLKDDDWVSVRGKVEMKSLDGFQIIFMDAENIKKVSKPNKNAAYIFD